MRMRAASREPVLLPVREGRIQGVGLQLLRGDPFRVCFGTRSEGAALGLNTRFFIFRGSLIDTKASARRAIARRPDGAGVRLETSEPCASSRWRTRKKPWLMHPAPARSPALGHLPRQKEGATRSVARKNAADVDECLLCGGRAFQSVRCGCGAGVGHHGCRGVCKVG